MDLCKFIKHWYARLTRCLRQRFLEHIVYMTSKMYVVDALQSLTTSVKLLKSWERTLKQILLRRQTKAQQQSSWTNKMRYKRALHYSMTEITVPLKTPMVKDSFQRAPFPIFEMGAVNQQWGNQQPFKEEYQFCARNWKAKRKNVFKMSGP